MYIGSEFSCLNSIQPFRRLDAASRCNPVKEHLAGPTEGLACPGAPWPAVKTRSGSFNDRKPDGKRFLMMKEAAPAGRPAAATDSRKIVIVLNWLEELKQRVPKK